MPIIVAAWSGTYARVVVYALSRFNHAGDVLAHVIAMTRGHIGGPRAGRWRRGWRCGGAAFRWADRGYAALYASIGDGIRVR
jgi:hypothetical protein